MEEEFSYLKSDDEWQEAVNAAYTCLLLAEACSGGLVTGGEDKYVDVGRCERALAAGRARGIEPSATAVEDWGPTLRGEGFKTASAGRELLLAFFGSTGAE